MLIRLFGLLSLASVTSAAASRAARGSLRARRDLHKNHVNAHGMRSSNSSSVVIYKGADFLDDSLWNYFIAPDPTHGQVNYLSRPKAQAKGLAYVQQDGKAVLKVDSTSDLPLGARRDSVRISSTRTMKNGLLIADFESMPFGCAVWPAFWTVGVGGPWPTRGEIDIVEGVNMKSANQYTFHTGADQVCNSPKQAPVVDNHVVFTGTVMNTNCSSSQEADTGCSILDAYDTSFGQNFSSAGGGVYALQRDEQGIKIWHFTRQSIPNDVSTGYPDTKSWPSPDAFLSADDCNIESFFSPQTLVIDTTLCGGWASSDYPGSGCPGTCTQQVTTGKNFVNAQWIINYIAIHSTD